MADQDSTEVKTSKLIEQYVQQHWDDKGTAHYLSNLGSRLKKELPESQRVLSDGLADFIRRNPVVKVVQHPRINQKIGAVPLSVAVPEQVEELFAKKASSGANSDGKWGSYDQAFWDAFIKPIDGEVRFVCVDAAGFEVSDGQPVDGKGKCFEIRVGDQTKELTGVTISERVAATQNAIKSWLEKNSLTQETFAAQKPNVYSRAGDRIDELFNVFGSLPEKDLARISIPLDILFKLNSKK
ncbi:hypothetical protein ACGYK1_18115 [Sulfitobacter sp. 1A13191]|uniref:hypothetical protein n=1 Tax=Sulfitobacter sp. 1A13191 TaxID=3368589 RepID=UPI003744B6A6